MTYTVPFGRTIRLFSVGKDTQGVQRALARAGFGELGSLLPVFGPLAYRNLKRFQESKRLTADGVYGPLTHRKLAPFFDDYAVLLYTGHPPPPPAAYLLLPATFKPTHETAGLPGYPALDVFAKAGTVVLAPADGTVTKLSGHDPAEGGIPGGAYGWSFYLTCATGDYFITHLGTRDVKLDQRVKAGERVGTVCDAKVAHMASSLSHVHLGLKGAAV